MTLDGELEKTFLYLAGVTGAVLFAHNFGEILNEATNTRFIDDILVYGGAVSTACYTAYDSLRTRRK